MENHLPDLNRRPEDSLPGEFETDPADPVLNETMVRQSEYYPAGAIGQGITMDWGSHAVTKSRAFPSA
ncbi:MAG TPA: hypothetical protein VHN59_06735 [Chitinophagaceae bacterium]|nr:hypothetical protein [Chitinophagaceae bacterium]